MRTTTRRLAVVLAAAVFSPLLAFSPAAADPIGVDEPVPIDETFTVAEGDGVDLSHGFPHISADPLTGRSLIVYNTTTNGGEEGGDTVRGRIIFEDGVIGEEFTINPVLPSAGFDNFEPPFASWNDDLLEWLVTWTDDEIVYGQRVDDNGDLIGDGFVVAASKSGITSDADNNFDDIEHVRAEWSVEHDVYLVSWKAAGIDATVSFDQTILATVIDKDGDWVLDGDAVDVSEEEANDGVAVAYSPESDVWLVAWERDNVDELPGARVLSVTPDGSDFDIVFDSAVLPISTSGTGAGGAPELTWDSTRDRFIIVWRADQGSGTQHYFNFVDPDGSFVEGDEVEFSEGDEYPFRARIAYSPIDDEYAVISHREKPPAPTDTSEGGPAPVDYVLVTFTISGDGAEFTETSDLADAGDRRARPSVTWGGGCFRYTWWDLGEFWNGSGLPDSVFARVECEGCFAFAPGSSVFGDVVLDAFYDIPVGWLFFFGITTGTAPGEFSPLDGVTRGQVATFIWRLEGEPDGPLGSTTFSDVIAGRFYDEAIGWMFDSGLTTGTSPTTFDPERVLTRGELATFLWRLAGEPDAPLGSASFGDVVAGRFYDEAIGWLFLEGITTGTSPTTFDPDRTLTRGEMATFLFRFVGHKDCITVFGF